MNAAAILSDMQARLANMVRSDKPARYRKTVGVTPRQPMSLRRMKAELRSTRYED